MTIYIFVGSFVQGVRAWCWRQRVGILSYSMSFSAMAMFVQAGRLGADPLVALAGMYAVMGLVVERTLAPEVWRAMWRRGSR